MAMLAAQGEQQERRQKQTDRWMVGKRYRHVVIPEATHSPAGAGCRAVWHQGLAAVLQSPVRLPVPLLQRLQRLQEKSLA